jgi:hypothetical protein
MNSQQIHQGAPAVGSNHTIAATQALPPNNLIRQNTQIGARQRNIRNLQEARHWIDRVKVAPHIDPATDATINNVDANRQAWIDAMIDAVYDLDHCNDAPKMRAHFLTTGRSSFQGVEVEAACHVLVDVLIDHCRFGFRGVQKLNLLIHDSSKVAEDEMANCQARAQNVLVALRTWKSICKGMIEYPDKKWQLANAPLTTIRQKELESKNNIKKKNDANAGKYARDQLEATKQSSRGSVASRSPGATSAESPTASTPDSFGILPLQHGPSKQESTPQSTPRGRGSVPHGNSRATAESLGSSTTGRPQKAARAAQGLGSIPHDNADIVTEPLDLPTVEEHQDMSPKLEIFGLSSRRNIYIALEPLGISPIAGFSNESPIDGPSHKQPVKADASIAAGQKTYDELFSSFAPGIDEFNNCGIDLPVSVFPAGCFPLDYLTVRDPLSPAYEPRPLFQQAQSHSAPELKAAPHQSPTSHADKLPVPNFFAVHGPPSPVYEPHPAFQHVPPNRTSQPGGTAPQAQAPRIALHNDIPSGPSASSMFNHRNENVHNTNVNDFGNMGPCQFNNSYHAQHQTNNLDHHKYYIGQGGLEHIAAPLTPPPGPNRASSSMADAQPQNRVATSSTPTAKSAHLSTPLSQPVTTQPTMPQPMVHGNYSPIGSKRAREEEIDLAPSLPSRRLKLNKKGSYHYSEAMSSGSSEATIIDGNGSEGSGWQIQVGGGQEAESGAFMGEELIWCWGLGEFY